MCRIIYQLSEQLVKGYPRLLNIYQRLSCQKRKIKLTIQKEIFRYIQEGLQYNARLATQKSTKEKHPISTMGFDIKEDFKGIGITIWY